MAGFTPEEAEEIRRQELEDIRRFGKVTDETRLKMLDLSVGIKGATEGLTRNFKSLGSSGINLAKQLNAGQIGASVFNNSIGGVSKAFGDLLGIIPYVGPALKVMANAAGDYAQAVNDQADLLYATYKELGAIGAATSGGIQDVYSNLKKFNFGTSAADLQQFTSLVRDNAETLVSFGKTVGSGVAEVANLAKMIHQEVGPEFLKMGISVDEINKGVFSFVKMQVLTGGRQKMTTDELVNATKEYIREVDLVTKMTGKTRAEQESSKQRAMLEERSAAYLYGLQEQINMGDKTAQAQLDTVNRFAATVDKVAPELRQGFLAVLTNTLTDPAAKKLLLTMPQLYAVTQKKRFEQDELEAAALKDLQGKSFERSRQLAAYGVNDKTFIKFNELISARTLFESGNFLERKAQVEKDTVLANRSTENLVAIELANRNSRDTLNDLINVGIKPVTTGLSKLAPAIDKTITSMTKMAEQMGVTVTRREPAAARPPAAAPAAEGVRVSGSAEAKASAEKYLGKAISDVEFSALIKATHAEAAGGKKASQQEQAMIMASVLNRARTDQGGLLGALTAKNQFQSVTGTANQPGPSQQYLKGPEKDRLKSIEGATKLLQDISLQQKNFTAADANAYGPGTNIGYRNKMLAAGGSVVGGSVFQTAPPAAVKGYKFGGVATGPTSGYMANLHGPEAVVPLPDGRTIPVQMIGADQQIGIMEAQLASLDDIRRVMQNQLGVSEKILKYAQ